MMGIFFATCAVLALAGALATVLCRNPIRGAIGLLTTIAAIAGLFLPLKAQFLAAIQLIVYAGAVVVLFVFVIMLLGPDAGAKPAPEARTQWSRWIGGAVLLLLAALTSVLVATSGQVGQTLFSPALVNHGSIEAVGGMLFTRGVVPFELATALLIVAVIGAVAVARSRPKQVEPRLGPSSLFHGPLHPRDAGRPLDPEAERRLETSQGGPR
ncbi:MAG TPA: NADH-quinone oxidoreductase subunit J [Polyangiaceae bacterium]|jgi:NADH-quinone oxidoreductase subunit J